MAALRLGRAAVGYDLSAEYVEMSRRRLAPLLARAVPLSLLDPLAHD